MTEVEIIKKIRNKQYNALLSIENVCFNDKEFRESVVEYELCCELLNEKQNEKTLDEIGQLIK